MRVVLAPDSFGGTLTPHEAARAMRAGWLDARPGDEVVVLPMSDGGEGLLDAMVHCATEVDERPWTDHWREVAGPRGLPVLARWIQRGPVAVIESALACGLALVEAERRDPRMTTTWGVGQLLTAAAQEGARRILVGLGGSATVDGGAGALSGLGWRVTVGDGSGLKIGGEDLARVADIAPGWVSSALDGVKIELLADVRTSLLDAPEVFGPQKGADPATIEHLTGGLAAWADVVEAVFDRPGLRGEPGTGAAGGLGYGLMAAHGAGLHPGAPAVAELVGLAGQVAGADLVVTGEGRLDATSFEGKVVGEVIRGAGEANVPVVAYCGQVDLPQGRDIADFRAVAVSPEGPALDPAAVLRSAVAADAPRAAAP